MSVTPPTTTGSVTAVGGNFQVKDEQGKTSTLSFASLLIKMGMQAMENSRGAFNSQYMIAQNKVEIMKQLNDLMVKLNTVKTEFKAEDKGDAVKAINPALCKEIQDFITKFPGVLSKGLTINSKNEVSKQNLDIFISNMQTGQSTLSSENEQQSMRTNQAMNRSSGFLQQLQGIMQTAKEALQAAAKTGNA